jgi:HSP20 family molecular chaperone IbpA
MRAETSPRIVLFRARFPLFSDLLTPQQPQGPGRAPAVDVLETDTEPVIRADLPGMTRDDVALEISGGMLVARPAANPTFPYREPGFP